MHEIVAIILPVFGLIGAGYLAGYFRILRPETGAGISDFAFTVGLPAIILRTVALADLRGAAPVPVLAAFLGAALATWVLASLMSDLILRRARQDAPILAMNSVFGNTVMIGVPLTLASFGDAAAAPIAIVLAVHSATLWIIGTLHVEWLNHRHGGQGASASTLLTALVRDVVCNPIVVAVGVGVAWNFSGLKLPEAIDKTLALMAQAGIPSALFALGLTLVRLEIRGQVASLLAVVGLKIAVMPAIAWVLAVPVLKLPPAAAGVAVIFASVPAGANSFLFAVRHGRAVDVSSGAVALGTLLATVTTAIVLSVMKPLAP